jgi:hypothetical protein
MPHSVILPPSINKRHKILRVHKRRSFPRYVAGVDDVKMPPTKVIEPLDPNAVSFAVVIVTLKPVGRMVAKNAQKSAPSK